PSTCRALAHRYAIALRSFDPEVVVFMVGPAAILDRAVDRRVLRLGTTAFASYFDSRLDAVRQVVASRRARLALTPVPCISPSRSTGTGPRASVERETDRVSVVNEVLHRYADSHADRVMLIDLHGLLCSPDSRSRSEYRSSDGVGFSSSGASSTWRLIASIAA